MSKLGREGEDGTVKTEPKSEVEDVAREVAHFFVEEFAEGEVENGGREVVDMAVELGSKGEGNDGRGEVIYILVEPKTEREVRDGGRKGVDWLVEHLPRVREHVRALIGEREVGDVRR